MNRRDFLKLLGVGAAAALIEEPVRKMWFVPSTAPVGSRVERVDPMSDHVYLADGRRVSAWDLGIGVDYGREGLVYRLTNSDEWFYRELSEEPRYEFKVAIEPTAELESYLDDAAKKLYPNGVDWGPILTDCSRPTITVETGWEPPAFGDGLAAYYQGMAEHEYAHRSEQADRFRSEMAGALLELTDCSGRQPRKT